MSTKPKYYIVESSALPEVFLKVAEAKRLLSTGEASTVNEATRMTDISRSAFYKYRDAVLPFQSMMTGRIITFQLLLHDEQGLLSEILGVFADAGANISTINSIVPTNGTAVVTISAETIDLTMTLEDLMNRLSAIQGVLKADVLAGSPQILNCKTAAAVFCGGFLQAAPRNSARSLSQDFCSNSKFQKWRNTVCISHF